MKRLYHITLFYTLLLLTGFSAKAQQTYAINGTVSDDKGGPVPGATVFITNSKYVTPTDNTGKFNFDNIQPGSYEVVIKMLGFNPVLQNVTVKEKPVNLVVTLTASVTSLNTVTIKAGPDPMRAVYMAWFLNNFIGHTVNSEQCKLLNPNVLRFHFDKEKKILSAEADEFLIVENKALGYQLKFLLTDFEYEQVSNMCTIGGSPYFEELKGTTDQQKKWDENRRLAYLSSDRHFFRSLINNTLEKDGFQVYAITSLAMNNTDKKYKGEYEVVKKFEHLGLFTYLKLYKPYREYRGYAIREVKDLYNQKIVARTDTTSSATLTAIPLSNAASLFFTDHANFKTLVAAPKILGRDTIRAKDTIALSKFYIVYTGEKESPLFYKNGSPINLVPFIKLGSKNRQITEVTPLADTITIDRNGGLTPAKGFQYMGYWAWQRIADLTPLDYFVEPVEAGNSKAQPVAETKEESTPGLKGAIAAIDTTRSRRPIEKLYLQTDKPYYTIGDTLWFKSYLLNADYLTPSTKSGMLYLELDNSNNQMVKRIMVPVNSGISWGDIALDPEEIPEGSYTLRAYTNWMRNFGEDYIFKKNIYISALSNSTLVKASFRLDSLAGKNKIMADLTFTGLDKNAIRLKDMQLKIMNGKHNLFKDKATTGMDGSLNINFDLADKTQLNNLSIIANQTGKGITDTATLTIPVTISRVENMDLQFMPEGGNLVAGIKTKIGFKAIGEDGKGVNVSGKIINSKSQTIINIQTIHKGMGSFELTPETGESYTAVINLPGKATKSYALPKTNPAGTALRITQKGDDSLEVVLSLKSGVESQKSALTQGSGLKTPDLNTYYLIGQSRGIVCYAATIRFKDQTIKKIIANNLFPTGITRFTLLNNLNQPLNERIVYINHNDNLDISIRTNKPDYATRDSIALSIQVKDKDGNPVQGIFGLAATDDRQVKADTIGSNIINDLLFTSDLKGTIEEPGWYFEQDSPDSYRDQDNNKTIALDNLLLTQGWVGYDWKNIFQNTPAPIQFPAEKKFIIQGKVTNVLNKPVEKSQVVLIGKTPAVFRDTLTGKDGIFTFKGLFPIDTAEFKLEARNINGKEFNVGIDMLNEFKEPAFSARGTINPWYVNSDTTLLSNANTKQAQLQAEANYRGEGHLLKEVKIDEKKIIPDSHNLNGPGEADQIIDEKEILKAKKMTLGELLEKKIKGFSQFGMWMPCSICIKPIQTSYLLGDRLIIFIFDGVNLNELYDGLSKLGPVKNPDHFNFIKNYMDHFTAEDIKGVEVMHNSKFANNYIIDFFHPAGPLPNLAFIEITTRSGHGPNMRITPGTYLYKPLPYTLPKEIYHPRYTVKNKNIAPAGTDLRSTIHWEPNVITDRDGKATVSFFSADKLSDYMIIMEGTDMNGNLGYKRQKIKAASKPTTTK